MSIETANRAGAARRRVTWLAAGVAAIAVGVAAVYGMAGFSGNAGGIAACRDARAVAARIGPLARGEVAALTVPGDPRLLPNLSFSEADGARRTLADWRGRTVLLNLWATWCVPCRKEMPALDALQARLGATNFEVVTVNIDTRDPQKPKNWLREAGMEKLAYYADPSAKVFQELKAAGKAFGMPTTLLVDPAGCELGALAGPAEWSSEDAVRLIESALRG